MIPERRREQILSEIRPESEIMPPNQSCVPVAITLNQEGLLQMRSVEEGMRDDDSIHQSTPHEATHENIMIAAIVDDSELEVEAVLPSAVITSDND